MSKLFPTQEIGSIKKPADMLKKVKDPNVSDEEKIKVRNDAALLNRAESYLTTKKYNQARADYLKLQSLRPDNPQIYLRFAQIAKAQNDPQEELKNSNLFLKYVDSESIPETELKKIQTRIKELESTQNGTP